MNFVIPQNFNLENKLFGFLDFSTAIFLVCFSVIIFFILNILPINFILKLFIFLILFFPLFILSVTGFYKENLIDVIFYLLKFLFSQKLYLYM